MTRPRRSFRLSDLQAAIEKRLAGRSLDELNAAANRLLAEELREAQMAGADLSSADRVAMRLPDLSARLRARLGLRPTR